MVVIVQDMKQRECTGRPGTNTIGVEELHGAIAGLLSATMMLQYAV